MYCTLTVTMSSNNILM
uniref:Uncharacterized protein n=1 Tax=Rhizophora mucronata TaxID=61149 RepID=A0A2P2QHC1_RHIMU